MRHKCYCHQEDRKFWAEVGGVLVFVLTCLGIIKVAELLFP